MRVGMQEMNVAIVPSRLDKGIIRARWDNLSRFVSRAPFKQGEGQDARSASWSRDSPESVRETRLKVRGRRWRIFR
jgi:hypothetical protein